MLQRRVVTATLIRWLMKIAELASTRDRPVVRRLKSQLPRQFFAACAD
jgi:hypothetical protein